MKILKFRTKTEAADLQERMDRIRLMLDKINGMAYALRGPEQDELGSVIEFPQETTE